MRKLLAAAVLASTALMTAPASAAITYYTDQAAFLAALNGTVTHEDFEDTTLATGLTMSSTVGSISSGRLNDQLAIGSQTTTFSFAGGANGFGGFFDMSPGGQGIGIALTTTPGGLLGTEVPRTHVNNFFGFISTDKFTSVLLTGGTQASGVETYNLDNVSFGTLAAVPEPATWAMMIGGFALIGASMRRRVTNVRFA